MRSRPVVVLTGLSLAGALVALGTGFDTERDLGGYGTSFSGRMPDQRHNAVLAARKINGKVVPPGGEFSFNKCVGSWSRDQGYRKAPVSFSGSLIAAWGGGVCQTSTTLYNAALIAGLQVTERHRHQFAANYVPPGRDAAVAFPNIDLRFKNTFTVPIRVDARVDGDRLIVTLRGRAQPRTARIDSQIRETRVPREYRFGTGALGHVRNPGKPGFDVATFAVHNGRRTLVSYDSYPAMNRVVDHRPAPQ